MSNAPYIGLWTRLHSFQRAELTALLTRRQVVRASSLRGTLHILTAQDFLLLHPVLQPTLSRHLHLFTRQAEGFDLDLFCNAMRAYIQERPRTGVELRAKMEEFCPGMGKQHTADAVRMHLALIQLGRSPVMDLTKLCFDCQKQAGAIHRTVKRPERVPRKAGK